MFIVNLDVSKSIKSKIELIKIFSIFHYTQQKYMTALKVGNHWLQIGV